MWCSDLPAFPPQNSFPAFNLPERGYQLFHSLTCTLCDTHHRPNFFVSRLYKEGHRNLVFFFSCFTFWSEHRSLPRSKCWKRQRYRPHTQARGGCDLFCSEQIKRGPLSCQQDICVPLCQCRVPTSDMQNAALQQRMEVPLPPQIKAKHQLVMLYSQYRTPQTMWLYWQIWFLQR